MTQTPPDEDESVSPANAPEAKATGLITGSTVFVFVAAGYLGALAIGVTIFRARPFVGGLAAIFALVLSRVLHMTIMKRAERR